MFLDVYLEVSQQIALKAGSYLKKHFDQLHHIESKSHINDLVTECDKFSEAFIKKELQEAFPNSSFICEESGEDIHNSSLTWIIDPLDGTVNFTKKIPFFSVSIALLIDKKLSVGVIYSPMTDELFSAKRGCGAFLNGRKIEVSHQNDLSRAFGATGFPYRVQDHVDRSLIPLKKLLERGVPLRRLGSACLDLAYVASGRFDLFFEAHLEPWDMAAGALLVEEAGGKISDFENKSLCFTKSSSCQATNGLLHNEMMQVLS